jgi:hypothetical protein
MPIAKPKVGQSKNDYISNCIDTEMGKGHSQQQAIAMCYSMWEKGRAYRNACYDYGIIPFDEKQEPKK